MKRILFIDRDGAVISETADEQIDSFEKLRFLPGVISALKDIVLYTDYKLVMVSNQDGLGGPGFPEERFWPVQNFMLDILENEGIRFSAVHIDRHYEEDRMPTRKPGTAMLTAYMNADYDLGNSYVIGDRDSDMQLAKNLHAKGIFIGGEHPDACLNAASWKEIRDFLLNPVRSSEIHRKTKETDIRIKLDLDGTGAASIHTGIGFFDHMLTLFAKHSGIDCEIEVKGDLEVDEHHSIEDTGLVLGQALREALGTKRGISRYGFLLPMDETLAQVALDLSGRPYLTWDVEFRHDSVGGIPVDMFKHFFRSLSDELRCNLHIRSAGENDHHIIEGVFKAFARSMRDACRITSGELPSTKGLL
ncbi:MAG: bifunctional histidinol-phosphatase/imidazoleglycerol-phosphate dehydratase HisB [FCB group bacterium]|nr:bifunctional histidinol-phosphatase/imidazoleglycerol-phosphate dehydratase HisB [FCB group bacterium]